jgi:hypothetical protein
MDDDSDGTYEDALEASRYTKWVLLVCEQTGERIVSQVIPGSEIGQYEEDQSRNGRDWRIAAFFDPKVEELLKSITTLGGNSIEVHENVTDIIMGVFRSFEEAKTQYEKWRSK